MPALPRTQTPERGGGVVQPERTPSGIAYDRAARGGGPRVDPTVRTMVGEMQRRPVELTAGWDDVEERALEPAARDRLAEIRVLTLVLVGALDAIHDAARRVAGGIAGARLVEWADIARLPSMERPDDFLALCRAGLVRLEPTLP